MRVLCVDPGKKNIGLAISDPTGTIANPLVVLRHESRAKDAAQILRLAKENSVHLIVIGQALDADDRPTPQSRSAFRLAAAIREIGEIEVTLWDESGSTQAARDAQIRMGTKRKKRRGHLDEMAATYILQTYLDAHLDPGPSNNP
jgi:putative Holliday junction resolvase